MTAEQIGLWAGLILSLMLFSYLLGDNFFYRLALFIFVGLTAAFVTIVTVESVIIPWVNTTLLSPGAPLAVRVTGLLPFLLGLLLLLKRVPRIGRLGNLALAFIIGVGTAVAIVGAISGTLLPLTRATGAGLAGDLLNGFLIVIGVISSLLYFQFSTRRLPGGDVRRGLLLRIFGAFGRGIITVTLGALYGTAILTGLTLFSERLAFIFSTVPGG